MDKTPKYLQPIIADGRALWLDKHGDKLAKRAFTDDESPVLLDMRQPVTLTRLADVAKRFDIERTIQIFDWRYYWPGTNREITDDDMARHFDNGLEGGYETRKKDYRYEVATNSLIIFLDGEAIYANDNGTITRDSAALADSLAE